MATFGNTTLYQTGSSIMDFIWGAVFTCPENGTADSITCGLYISEAAHKVKCAIYKASDSSLVGVTEEKDLSPETPYHWETFNFSSPKPSLQANTDYVLVAWGEPETGLVYFAGTDEAAGAGRYDSETYNDYPDPASFTSHSWTRSIYCTYTPSGATYTKTWATDVLFKKLGILKTFGIDVGFLKQNIVKSFAVDTRFGAMVTYTISRQIDVLFKKLGVKAFDIDVTLEKPDISKTFAIDVDFLKTTPKTLDLNALFKKPNITTSFFIDACFGAVEAVTHSRSFALDVVFAYKVRLPEILLDEEGKIVLNVSRPYVWVGG